MKCCLLDWRIIYTLTSTQPWGSTHHCSLFRFCTRLFELWSEAWPSVSLLGSLKTLRHHFPTPAMAACASHLSAKARFVTLFTFSHTKNGMLGYNIWLSNILLLCVALPCCLVRHSPVLPFSLGSPYSTLCCPKERGYCPLMFLWSPALVTLKPGTTAFIPSNIFVHMQHCP